MLPACIVSSFIPNVAVVEAVMLYYRNKSLTT